MQPIGLLKLYRFARIRAERRSEREDGHSVLLGNAIPVPALSLRLWLTMPAVVCCVVRDL